MLSACGVLLIEEEKVLKKREKQVRSEKLQSPAGCEAKLAETK